VEFLDHVHNSGAGFGGRIDLLAIAPDGALVLIELNRNRTPREVVAQSLDYAGWVEPSDRKVSPPFLTALRQTVVWPRISASPSLLGEGRAFRLAESHAQQV
jgi:hypothetical protein